MRLFLQVRCALVWILRDLYMAGVSSGTVMHITMTSLRINIDQWNIRCFP